MIDDDSIMNFPRTDMKRIQHDSSNFDYSTTTPVSFINETCANQSEEVDSSFWVHKGDNLVEDCENVFQELEKHKAENNQEV